MKKKTVRFRQGKQERRKEKGRRKKSVNKKGEVVM